jgi:hypothetical protein
MMNKNTKSRVSATFDPKQHLFCFNSATLKHQNSSLIQTTSSNVLHRSVWVNADPHHHLGRDINSVHNVWPDPSAHERNMPWPPEPTLSPHSVHLSQWPLNTNLIKHRLSLHLIPSLAASQYVALFADSHSFYLPRMQPFEQKHALMSLLSWHSIDPSTELSLNDAPRQMFFHETSKMAQDAIYSWKQLSVL